MGSLGVLVSKTSYVCLQESDRAILGANEGEAMELSAVLTPATEGGFIALNPETGTTTQGETYSILRLLTKSGPTFLNTILGFTA